jgi:hypothetical protein
LRAQRNRQAPTLKKWRRASPDPFLISLIGLTEAQPLIGFVLEFSPQQSCGIIRDAA